MIIDTGTLFFVLAVFVNCIELSLLNSFWDLFPDVEILPPAKTLKYKDAEGSWNLRKLVDYKVTEFDLDSKLLARAHVIVGWLNKDRIEPLSDLSGKTDHVFDSKAKQFVKLHESELGTLGVDRLLMTIRTIDEVFPICRPNANAKVCRRPVYHLDDKA